MYIKKWIIYFLLKRLDLPENVGFEHVHSEWITLMTRPWMEARIFIGPVWTRNVTAWNRYGRCSTTSKQLLNDNISKYLDRIMMSPHKTCCSRAVVGEIHVCSNAWKWKENWWNCRSAYKRKMKCFLILSNLCQVHCCFVIRKTKLTSWEHGWQTGKVQSFLIQRTEFKST